jgi:hypothetical protein
MKQASTASEGPRLVKLILSADLVRRMDRAILASSGGYQDRNEFVTEAIRDRLTEEAAALADGAPDRDGLSRAASSLEPPRPLFGIWQAASAFAAESGPGEGVNFGLHNRDLPSLWALDRLVVLASEAGAPVPWADFVEALRNDAIRIGEWLRARDIDRRSGIRTGIGFPKPGAKVEQSIDRFVAANVGVNGRRPEGPFFVLGLATFVDEDRNLLAPTRQGVEVLSSLIDRGLGGELPQPEPALRCWWSFVAAMAPQEHEAWQKVLRVLAERPTRRDLIAAFPEWRGATADTNSAGFVSRSREWGLVEPELIEQRYRLTALGATVLEGN